MRPLPGKKNRRVERPGEGVPVAARSLFFTLLCLRRDGMFRFEGEAKGLPGVKDNISRLVQEEEWRRVWNFVFLTDYRICQA